MDATFKIAPRPRFTIAGANAEGSATSGASPPARSGVREIAGERVGADPVLLLELSGERHEPVLAACDKQQTVAASGELARYLGPDSGRSAGHQGR